MAVPPPASWIDAPKSVYATDGRVSLRWWCGGSQDVVTGCKLTVATSEATTFTTDVTTQSSTYEWRYAASMATLGMDTPGTYKISVYGYNGEGNGDAAFATVQVYVAPAVSILSPADSEVVTGLPFTASWTASDTSGIAEQVLYLYDSSLTTLYLQRSLDGSARSFTFDVGDGMLANDGGYTLIVGATSGVGLYGSNAARFTTAWMPPAQPTATIEVDEDSLGTTITVMAGEGSDAPATESMSIARVDADGTRWVIATGLSSGAVVHDPLPPLGVPYTYEITAVSNTGATSVGTVDMTITTGFWAFNFGARATEHAKLRFNAKTAMSTTHGGDSYHFADGGQGNGLPVYYATTDRDISGSGSWDTVGQADADRINALTLRYPVGWMRDPYGHRYRAHMRWSIDHRLPASRVWAISLDWDAVRFTEAW